jgi:hypothetical protein
MVPVWLYNCIITGCDSVGVSLDGWDGFILETTIEQNGIGVLTMNQDVPHIWYTEISENSTGMYAQDKSKPKVRCSKIISNSVYGVYITDNAKPHLGGRGHNYIFGNELYDVYNNTANDIIAKKNYWGTMNMDTVHLHIYDYYDDISRGMVKIEPLWDGDQHLGGPMSSGETQTPLLYALRYVSPNPFSNNTIICYSIAKPGKISLKVYDIAGKYIRTLEEERKDAGIYSVNWNGCDFAGAKASTGIYFIQLVSRNFTCIRKIIFIR